MCLKTLKQMKACLIYLSKKVAQIFTKNKETTTNTYSNTKETKNEQGETNMENTANNNEMITSKTEGIYPITNAGEWRRVNKKVQRVDFYVEYHAHSNEIELKKSEATGLTYFEEHGERYYLLHQIKYFERMDRVRGQRHARCFTHVIRTADTDADSIFYSYKRKIGKYVYVPEWCIVKYIKERDQIAKAKIAAGGNAGAIVGWSLHSADLISAEWGIDVTISKTHKNNIPAIHHEPIEDDKLWYKEFMKSSKEVRKAYKKKRNVNRCLRRARKVVNTQLFKHEDDLFTMDFKGRTKTKIENKINKGE